jgi:hypothetical protein
MRVLWLGRAARLHGLLVGISLAAVLTGAAPAQATGRGLLVAGETLNARALEPILTFSNGAVVGAQSLAAATPLTGYEADDLFVHDLASGSTWLAEANVGELAIESPLERSASRLIELFDTPGVAVLFESSVGGPANPLTAEVFSVHRPLRGTAQYYPALTREVPEPDGLLMLACGAGLLATLSRCRARSNSMSGGIRATVIQRTRS